jgi:hypothetical protein
MILGRSCVAISIGAQFLDNDRRADAAYDLDRAAAVDVRTSGLRVEEVLAEARAS